MTDHTKSRTASELNLGPLLGFAIGALAGAGVALMLAPSGGTRSRQELNDAGRRIGKNARRALKHASDSAHALRAGATAAIAEGRKAFEHDGKPESEPPGLMSDHFGDPASRRIP